MSLLNLFNKSHFNTVVSKENQMMSMTVSQTRLVTLDEIEEHPTGCLVVEGVLVATECGHSVFGTWVTYKGKHVCPSYHCYLREDHDKKVWNLYINNKITKTWSFKDVNSPS
jgi:hypothetical protein